MTILVQQLRAEIEQLQAEIKRLGGVRPDFPPRPPDGEGLPRYGIRWNGPQDPLTVPMEDGYWTPWHLAARQNWPVWVACSDRLPTVAEFDQQEFIVTVQRKGKVITMSALYLNAYPLYCEDHDDADEEGYVPHTGWYDAKSNGDDANCYSLISDSWYGSEVTHWVPMPEPAPIRVQNTGQP